MMITKTILKKVYKKRRNWSHKFDFGSLLIIGGSRVYSGSPGFNALAALRSGCDLVTIAAPQRSANIVASFSPDLITHPLKGDYLTNHHVKYLINLSKKMDAVVIGGGLGRNKQTLKAVDNYLKKTKIPAVVDADAIHAVAHKELRNNIVLTPHSREFYVLTGKKPGENLKERIRVVKKTANDINAVILLKGHIDIISDGLHTALNNTGNTYMTKGGTGDTLAGICGSLLAQGASQFDAACASAYINGAAGDLAAKTRKQSLLATDVLDKIDKITNIIK